jgi:hypothetical protein
MCAATRRRVRSLLIAAWLSGSLAFLQAATLERLSLDETIQESTAIVRGRVLGSHAAFRGSVIYTHYRVQVLERWKGGIQSTLEVLVPGGVSAGLRQTYTGVPELVNGKEYVLFLWTGRSGLTQIIGYTQGVFELPKAAGKGETMAHRAASTETMLDRATGRPVKDEPLRISLSALSSRIAAVLAKGAGK